MPQSVAPSVHPDAPARRPFFWPLQAPRSLRGAATSPWVRESVFRDRRCAHIRPHGGCRFPSTSEQGDDHRRPIIQGGSVDGDQDDRFLFPFLRLLGLVGCVTFYLSKMRKWVRVPPVPKQTNNGKHPALEFECRCAKSVKYHVSQCGLPV